MSGHGSSPWAIRQLSIMSLGDIVSLPSSITAIVSFVTAYVTMLKLSFIILRPGIRAL